jgi:hypothetical protein
MLNLELPNKEGVMVGVLPEFQAWPKTERLKGLHVTITEKIDGTNAAVIIEGGKVVGCQSRKRLLSPGKDTDNFGFAGWVEESKDLLRTLGDGYHYGEWAGPGIQKNPHGLDKKTFFLFSASRWNDDPRPAFDLPQLSVVPVLYQGPYNPNLIDEIMDDLDHGHLGISDGKEGTQAEGMIIYFNQFRMSVKHTLVAPEGKWLVK